MPPRLWGVFRHVALAMITCSLIVFGGIAAGSVADSNVAKASSQPLNDYQVSTNSWNKSIGPKGSTLADVVETSAGDFIAVGAVPDGRSQEAYALKFDSSGSIIWEKSLPGYFARSIINTENGFIIAGQTSVANPDSWDGWVLKISQDGSILWETSFGGQGNDYFQEVVEGDSGYYLAGGSYSYGEDRSTWVAKVEFDGTEGWNQSAQGTGFPPAAATVEDGGVLVATRDRSENQALVFKLDESGEQTTSKHLSPDGQSIIESVAVTPDGGYLFAGFSDGGWVRKTSKNLETEWEITGLTGGPNTIAVTNNGGYLVGSRVLSLENRNTSKYMVTGITNEGKETASQQFDPTQYIDSGDAILVSTSGDLVIAGFMNKTIRGVTSQGWLYGSSFSLSTDQDTSTTEPRQTTTTSGTEQTTTVTTDRGGSGDGEAQETTGGAAETTTQGDHTEDTPSNGTTEGEMPGFSPITILFAMLIVTIVMGSLRRR